VDGPQRSSVTRIADREPGLQKVGSWESTIRLFQDEYKVPLLRPEAAATMSASFEIGCSILLLLGLFTCVATLPLLGMIAVIQIFVYPQAWSEHLTWVSILLFLLARGGGAIAVDRLLGVETSRRGGAQFGISSAPTLSGFGSPYSPVAVLGIANGGRRTPKWGRSRAANRGSTGSPCRPKAQKRSSASVGGGARQTAVPGSRNAAREWTARRDLVMFPR
jgi:uncharacterized membrane protein YphA (DoxX/SURF4 family)